MAKANQGSKPSTSNLVDLEYSAANAAKVLGFKIISCFDKLSDTKKSTVVSHNMNILSKLPSEIKMSIIKKCIKNKSDDYVGLQYLNLYVRGQEKQVLEQEPEKAISKKRSKSDESTDSKEKEENWTPPKKKREKEKAVVEASREETKEKITEEQNSSRQYFFKNRKHVKYADSEGEERKRAPSKKKRGKEKVVVEASREETKEKITEEQNSSREYFFKNRKHVKYADSEGEERKRVPSKKKRGKGKARAKTKVPMPAPPESSIPEKIKEKIAKLNGTDIKWVYTKRLYDSDVVQYLNRLSMPLKQINIDFLTAEERERLDEEEGVEVGMVGPTGELSRSLVLKKWRMEKKNGNVTITYNLITGWYKDIVEANGLKIGHLVHVWSFREGKNLSFALVKVDE